MITIVRDLLDIIEFTFTLGKDNFYVKITAFLEEGVVFDTKDLFEENYSLPEYKSATYGDFRLILQPQDGNIYFILSHVDHSMILEGVIHPPTQQAQAFLEITYINSKMLKLV